MDKTELDSVALYSDGSAKSNPDGPGGYGTVLEFTDSKGELHVREYSAGFIKTTNNRMEMMGVITGLEALNRPCRVTVVTDSQYVVNAFNNHWLESWQKKGWRKSDKTPVKNVDLWKRLLEAASPHEVTFKWVKGHAGHPQNERCDQLACAAAEGTDLLTDPLFA